MSKVERYQKDIHEVNTIFAERYGLIMAKKNTNKELLRVKLGEFPEGMKVEDFPDDTIFVLDDLDERTEDSFWEDE